MHRVGRPAVTRILSACFFVVFAVFSQPLSAQSKDQSPKEGIEVGAPEPARPSANAVTAAGYPFTSATGVTLEDMSSGTTQLVAASQDDTASPLTNIGFEFWYDGVRMTQFAVNSNGLMRLGTAVTGGGFNNATEFATTTNAPKIVSFWDDQCTSSTGKVHYKLVGSAPNRKLVVEWLNMVAYQAGCTAGPAIGTYQTWLFESTGVIQSVYGAIPGTPVGNGGYSVGLQSGAATNFASVTTVTSTVSYAAANNTQVDPITGGTSYFFTPNVPVSPTNLTFTGTTAIATTLNWTDNSTDELGFVIYRSTDGGATFNFLTQTAANATSFTDSGLSPSTTYFYRVYAVTEGALSASAATGQVTTSPAGSVISTAAGGNWSDVATWVGGVLPTASDNVTIVSGATVTIDTAAAAWSLTVSGLLQFEPTTARSLTVGTDVTILASGVLQSAASGTQTGHVLSLNGNLTNTGTLNFSTNANTAGALITFTGASNTMFSGAGPTNIRQITVNKGSSSASVVEMTTPNFTVQGVNTDVAGFLTLTNGTLKISSAFTMTNRVFLTPAYTIPFTAGIWLNNPNFTVVGQAGGATTLNNGLFRVTQGVYNIGIGVADGMGGNAGAVFIIEGGTVNASGRLDPQGAVSYTQTGGTVNVAIVGNNVSSFGSFEIFGTGSSFTMSGGTINLINRSTGASQWDFDIRAVTFNVTGGLVVFGGPGAPAGTSYNISSGPGLIPNFTVNPTMTLNINNVVVALRGTNVTNDGAIISTGAARFDFGGSAPMSYGGAGTFGTLAAPFAGAGISSGSTSLVTLNSPIVTNRVNLFQGGFVNSNQITLGNGGASQTLVQVGAPGNTTPGGNFDVSPLHNQGTGGEVVNYLFETAPRTTGVEINPTRALFSMIVDNPNNVTIAGGNLTLTNLTTALTLTNGRVITGNNTLALASGTATVTRTNGYVDGNYQKDFAAPANKTFEVGTANGYSPVVFNATAATTFPVDVTIKATQTTAPGLVPTATALTRYWTLTVPGAPGTVTADLTFNYLAADVPGTANENNFKLFRHDLTPTNVFTDVGGTVTPATHQASVTGISQFSDWTLAEAALLAPTAIVSGDATICAGASAIISATLTGTSPWSLTWSDGFIQSGITSSPATRSVSPITTTIYTVTAISDANGAGSASGSATITVNSAPTPVISSAQSVPVGGTGSASAVNHAGSSYAWNVSGGTILTGQGTASITYAAGTPGTRMTITVVETTSAGCTSPTATKKAMVDFLDVPPSHLFHDFVIKLAINGVTAGCGGGNFCPDNDTLRSQMAIFLLRGEHGETYAPPPAVGIFADVPVGSFAADFIEQLYAEGITGGCGTNPLRYCPSNSVLRSQMAIFLLRAEHGGNYAPPPAIGIFADVPVGSFAADFIEQLYGEGVTGGCGTNPLRYCPNNTVTRGAMAVFLVRTFNLQ